jgi:chromosome segregation ATPase
MNALASFAERLKAVKAIDKPVATKPPDAGAGPTPIANGFRKGTKRRRYSPSQHALLCLKSRLAEANRRADRAEARLAAIQANVNSLAEMNREIERLCGAADTRAAKAETALAAAERVRATNEKIWRLNQEIKRLRTAQRLRLKPLREQVARRAGAERELAYARARIANLEAENERLRKMIVNNGPLAAQLGVSRVQAAGGDA